MNWEREGCEPHVGAILLDERTFGTVGVAEGENEQRRWTHEGRLCREWAEGLSEVGFRL